MKRVDSTNDHPLSPPPPMPTSTNRPERNRTSFSSLSTRRSAATATTAAATGTSFGSGSVTAANSDGLYTPSSSSNTNTKNNRGVSLDTSTASFLHSAARSVLDDATATPSSIYSDADDGSATAEMRAAAAIAASYSAEEGSMGSSHFSHSKRQQPRQRRQEDHTAINDDNDKVPMQNSKSTSSRTIWHPLHPDANGRGTVEGAKSGGGGGGLASLQTQTLPAIPDEQDRKRFIGCLAVVLASSYDYDFEYLDENHNNVDAATATTTTSSTASSNQYLGNDFYDEYFHSDDEDDNGFEEENKERLSRVQSTTSDDASSSSDYSRHCASFESFGAQEDDFSRASTGSSRSGRKSDVSNRYRNQHNHPPSSSSRRLSSQASSASTRRGNINSKANRATLARDRHKSRRYDVMSRLLISSGEKLLLERSVSRAFLPMLSPVLVPQWKSRNEMMNNPTTTNLPSINERRPGTGRVSISTLRHSRSAPSSPLHSNSQEDSYISTSRTNASFSAMGGAEYASVMDASSFSVDRRKSSFRNDDDGDDDGDQSKGKPVKNFIMPVQNPILDNEEELKPFLESLTPGAGFRCVSLLLLQHLLMSEVGYDARTRHVLKKLSVLVLMHDMEHDPVEFDANRTRTDMLRQATRKFEYLEHSVAKRLLRLSASARERKDSNNKSGKAGGKGKPKTGDGSGGGGISRQQILRGVKIGGAGIVAGTLFALTGGLAAPGIAAGVAAVAGAAAGTAAVTTLTSAAVVTTIFGVGGGGLAAYKMQRRTQGLTEFEFHKETASKEEMEDRRNTEGKAGVEAELFSVLCISGWLRDNCDYQRPWGLQPSEPKIQDRQELLERFYSVHSPDHVPKCSRILSSWKGEEDKLWKVLRDKYGQDPDTLFPLPYGPNVEGNLTLEQEEVLDKLFVELGYNSVAPEVPVDNETQPSPFEKMKSSWLNRSACHAAHSSSRLPPQYQRYDSTHGTSEFLENENSFHESIVYSNDTNSSFSSEGHQKIQQQLDEKEGKPPKHLDTVWDYKMTFGGELYTVKWESELLQRICDCVMDLAFDVVSGATKHFLKQTVLATLMSAVMWPSYLLNVANMIDGDWTLAVERADEAGKVLAKTLLFSRAGRRPVTLVGYSFGARIIYSCLKELARYQEDWENYQDLLEEAETGTCSDEARFAQYQKKLKGIREPASIVEDAVLLGLPNHLSLPSWRACRQVVAGRLVNCYSSKDLILSLMFQAKRFSGGSLNAGMGSILKPVCGTCPVKEPGIENVDVSDLILGHQDYCLEIGKILERIRFGEPFRCSTGAAADMVDVTLLGNETAKKLTY